MKTVVRAGIWGLALVGAVYVWSYHQLAIEVASQRAATERLEKQIEAMQEQVAGQLERLRR